MVSFAIPQLFSISSPLKDIFIFYPIIAFASGSPMNAQTTKQITTNSRFGFNVGFIVKWPGPKKNGDGTAADGVMVAIPDAIAMIRPNAARLMVLP